MEDKRNHPKDELKKIVDTIEGTIGALVNLQNHIQDIMNNDLINNLDVIHDRLRNAGCISHPTKDFSSNIVYMIDQLIEKVALK